MKRHRAYTSDDSMAKFIDLSPYDTLSLQVNEKTKCVKVLKRRHGVVFVVRKHYWTEGIPASEPIGRAKRFLMLLLRRLIHLPIIESRRATVTEQYMQLAKELRLL